MYSQFRVVLRDIVIAKQGDAGDGVHLLLMQEAHVLRQIWNGAMSRLRRERMFKGDAQAAIAVLDIEDDGVAANCVPALYDVNPLGAACHGSRQIDGADLVVLGNWN